MTDAPVTDLPEFELDEEQEKHTLLEVWREVLSNIDAVREQKVGPADASKILRMWPNLRVQELGEYHDLFYDYMTDLRAILHAEIDSDPQALERVEDDGEENHAHYLNLLLQWHLQLQLWSDEWFYGSEKAHIEMAALSEAQSFIFGPNGMAHHLDQIEFVMGEDEANLISDALIEARGGGGE